MNIFAVKGILKTEGFDCDECNDGLEAIQKVKERHEDANLEMYELIFMDYSMPNCNGCEATV